VKEQAKQQEMEALRKIEQDQIKWVLLYSPEDGWGPEKKKELYRLSVVNGVYPNEHEQPFLDHFDEWMTQYKIWEQLQEEAKKKEQEETQRESKEHDGENPLEGDS